MKCPNCGAGINDVNIQKFCEACGFELDLKANDGQEPLQQINPKPVKTSRRRCC